MMNKLLKIDSILYRVKNLKTAQKFYTDALGLSKKWGDKKEKMIGFVFEQSDSEIVIHNNPAIPNSNYGCPEFLVKNVEKFIKECKKKGCVIELEPIDVRCGKYAVILDLDGNKIPVIDLTKFGGKPKYNI